MSSLEKYFALLCCMRVSWINGRGYRFLIIFSLRSRYSRQSHSEPSFILTNRMGKPAGDDDGRMNPFARFLSSHIRRTSSSCLESEYSGPKDGLVLSRSWMLWSPGWCGGSRLASASDNRVTNSCYSLGISGEWSWFGCSSMASMSAVEIANVMSASCRQHFILTVFLNVLRETAVMSMVYGHGGGISIVVTLVGRGAHVVIHCGETMSMVSIFQSMCGL